MYAYVRVYARLSSIEDLAMPPNTLPSS